MLGPTWLSVLTKARSSSVSCRRTPGFTTSLDDTSSGMFFRHFLSVL